MSKKEVLDFHKKLKGKFSIEPKAKLDKRNLSLLYTPGVAETSKAIFKDKRRVYDYTIKKNCVGIVSDGSAVLGLGNIGAEASLPVMEGKAILFKKFAGIDAFPICLKTQNSSEIVNIVKNLSPIFGGINLEDISAPRCFEIEEALQDLEIPVMHDDQHGTAVVVLAGLINATKVLGKKFEKLRVVINGAGAAGTAIANLLVCAFYKNNICRGVDDVIVLDSKGVIYEGREKLNEHKRKLSKITNRRKIKGNLEECLKGADVFIGVSKGNILSKSMISRMNCDPIIFALANPTPEIMPNKALNFGARIVATGRSDFPNQVNNVLVFPGIFKGALNSKAKEINSCMKLNAAYALAAIVKKPSVNKILPSIFDRNVVRNIARAVKKCV